MKFIQITIKKIESDYNLKAEKIYHFMKFHPTYSEITVNLRKNIYGFMKFHLNHYKMIVIVI